MPKITNAIFCYKSSVLLDISALQKKKTVTILLPNLYFFLLFLTNFNIFTFNSKSYIMPVNIEFHALAEVAELVDAQDSGNCMKSY